MTTFALHRPSTSEGRSYIASDPKKPGQTYGVGNDLGKVLIKTGKIGTNYNKNTSRELVLQNEYFNRLANWWKDDTMFNSSLSEMVSHPAYTNIISMGRIAIPYIIGEIERHPSHWFYALHMITGENPVKPEHVGKVKLMANDWLDWAKENGYR